MKKQMEFNKLMKKIAFFTHTDISSSETFIFDLVVNLNDKFKGIFYCGKNQTENNSIGDIPVIATGFSEKAEGKSYKAYKLAKLVGKNAYLWKNEVQRKISNRQLKKYVELSDISIAYIDYATSLSLVAPFLNLNKIPYVVHVHGYDVTSAFNDPVYKNYAVKALSNAKAVITASHFIRKLLILEGVTNDKIKVIPYGIQNDDIVPTAWEERLITNPRIVFLGRLTKKKNPIALLEAFNIVRIEIPEATLTIIGDGPLRKEIEERINLLNLKNNVFLKGTLSRIESFPILNESWIYAQHSVSSNSGDKEGFAISPAEAALHELPVVATLHNGLPEHIIDGETGFLVPEFDFEMMANKIIYLIKNPEVMIKFGKAGRKNIINYCSVVNRINSISEIINKYGRF